MSDTGRGDVGWRRIRLFTAFVALVEGGGEGVVGGLSWIQLNSDLGFVFSIFCEQLEMSFVTDCFSTPPLVVNLTKCPSLFAWEQPSEGIDMAFESENLSGDLVVSCLSLM